MDSPMSAATDDLALVEALAEAWASIDGKAEKFLACKADRAAENNMGHYGGYVAEARELIRRLERRGYTVTPKVPE